MNGQIIMQSYLNRSIHLLLICLCISLVSTAQTTPVFDIVLTGGRVIDPETQLDAVRNVGINGGRIAEISAEPLKGKEMINASGLVVAPGFIDLHVHGRSNTEQEYQMHDGVTTALELEWGIEFIKEWYASRKSKALINYGASVCWPFERFRSLDNNAEGLNQLKQLTVKGESQISSLFKFIGPSYTVQLTNSQLDKTLENIRESLKAGGIGIGVPIGYLPSVHSGEVFRVFQLASALHVPVFSHVREPSIEAIQEVMADAEITGASLHIVHINSMSLGQIKVALEMISMAQQKGFDITTELYPYTAASTLLQSAMFDDGWQEKLNISYNDLQWVATGERLTKQSFETNRKAGGAVIMHMMKPEWIAEGIASKGTMIASDGMPYAKLAHPRTAGTFSRTLGKYVREDKVLSLPDAIEKMTLLPAKRLEGVSPMMRFKGRIQVGADADITIFDPEKVIDKASFEKGLEFSAGIEYVLVNGTLVVKNGKTVNGVLPGQPVYGKYKN